MAHAVAYASRLVFIIPGLRIRLAAARVARQAWRPLLAQLYLSSPHLALAPDELPRPYALYRVIRQRRYRNAPALARLAPVVKLKILVVKPVFCLSAGISLTFAGMMCKKKRVCVSAAAQGRLK